MDESEGNIKPEDVNNVDSPTFVKTKPKKRSLVERELETNLTARVTSPATSEGSSTSRYGRARKLKTATDLDAEKMSSPIMKPLKIDVSKQPQAYKMHASNSPISKDSTKRTISVGSSIEDQIENIYSENISLSRFGSDEKSKSPAKKFSKIYIRKDLIQKPDTDTVVLIKNMFSPNKSSSHLNNILERSSEKYSLNGHGKGLSFPDSSVVKTLDFDSKKKNKAVTTMQPKAVTAAQPKPVTAAQPKLVTAVQPIKKEFKEKVVSKNELFELEAACEYQVGDLAWARVGTYPYWPCIVTREPFSDMFVKKKLFGRVERSVIHVTFFGDNGRRGWIVDNMLRKYHGRAEFEACRDKFTPESKKKDPRLYAAHFVSEKKLSLWNISVEEAETLMKEPKRLRIDALYDMLEKARAAKTTPNKREKSGKISRTDSDVSLSESLYDTLFSEDDGKTDDNNRLKKARNKSLDVSEVVTACLDNMAAKSGIIQIQRQSHMDRWLQKAKSKTPEKMQPKLHIKAEREKRKDAKKKKEGKKQKMRKNESLGSDANLLPYQNEHDYSSVNYENHDINDSSNKNTDSASALDSTLDTTLGTSSSDIGVTVKIENISSSMDDCSQDDILTTVVNDDIVMTDPENISRDDYSQETLAHSSKESQNNNEDNLVIVKKDDNEFIVIKEEFPLNCSEVMNIVQPRRSKRKRQKFEGLNDSITENKAKEPKLDLSGQKAIVDTKTADDRAESNKHQESTLESIKDSEKTVEESEVPIVKSVGKETSRNDRVESMELNTLNSKMTTVSNAPTVSNIETRKSKRNKQESIELTSSNIKSEPVVVNEPIISETTSVNEAKELKLESSGQKMDITTPDDIPENSKHQENLLETEIDSEKIATDTKVSTIKNIEKETSDDKPESMASSAPAVAKIETRESRKKKRESTELTSSNNKSKPVIVIEPITFENTLINEANDSKLDLRKQTSNGDTKIPDDTLETEKEVVVSSENNATNTKVPTIKSIGKETSSNDKLESIVSNAPTVASTEKQKSRKSNRKSTQHTSSNNKSEAVVVIQPLPLTNETTLLKKAKEPKSDTTTPYDTPESNKNQENTSETEKDSENTTTDTKVSTMPSVGKETSRSDQIDSVELTSNSHNKPANLIENTTAACSAPTVANIEKQVTRKSNRKSTQHTLSNNKSEAVVVIKPITTETTSINESKEPRLDLADQKHNVDTSPDDILDSNKNQESSLKTNNSEKTTADTKVSAMPSVGKETSRSDQVDSVELTSNTHNKPADLIDNFNTTAAYSAPTVANIEKQTRKSNRKSTEHMLSNNKSEAVVVIKPMTTETTSINESKEPRLDLPDQKHNVDTSPDDILDSNKNQESSLKTKNSEKTTTDTKVSAMPSVGKQTSRSDQVDSVELTSNTHNKPADLIDNFNTTAACSAPTVANIEKQVTRKSNRKSTQHTLSNNKSEAVVVIKPMTTETTSINESKEPRLDLEDQKHNADISPDDIIDCKKNQKSSLETKNSEKTTTDTKVSEIPSIGKETSRSDQIVSMELTSNSNNKPADLTDNFENTTTSSSALIVANIEKQKSRKSKRKSTQNTSSDNKSESIVVIETITTETASLEKVNEPKSALSGQKSNVEKTTPDDTPESNKNRENTLETVKNSENTATDTKVPTVRSIGSTDDKLKKRALDKFNSDNKPVDVIAQNNSEITTTASTPTVVNIEKRKSRKKTRESTELTSSNNISEGIEPITPENTSIDINTPTNTRSRREKSQNKNHEAKLTPCDDDVKTLAVKEPLNPENNLEITASTVANVEKQTIKKSKRKSTDLTAMNGKSKPVVIIEKINSENTSESNEPSIKIIEKESQDDKFGPTELMAFNIKSKPVVVIEQMNSENTSTEMNALNVTKETFISKYKSIELMPFNSNSKPVVIIEPLDMKGLETQLIIKGSKQLIKNKTLDSVNSDSVKNTESPIADVGQHDVNDILEDDNNTIKECTGDGSLEKINDKAILGEMPSQFHDIDDCHQKADESINSEKNKTDDCVSFGIEDRKTNTTLANISETDPIEKESERMEVVDYVYSDVKEGKANTHLTPQVEMSKTNSDFSVTTETKSTEAPKQLIVNNQDEIPKNNITTNVVIGEETYIFDRTLSQDYDEIDGDNYDEYSHLPPVIITKEADAYLIDNKRNIHEETVPHNSNVANDSKSSEKVSTPDDDLASKDNSGSCIFSEKVNLQTYSEITTQDDNKATLITNEVSNTINDEKNKASDQVTEENNDKCVFLDQSSTTADAQFADVTEKKRKSTRFKLNRNRFHLLKLNKAENIEQPSDNIIESVNTDPRTNISETSQLLTNGNEMSINVDVSSDGTQKSKKSKNDPEFIKYLELRQDAILDEQPDLSQDEIVTYLYQNWLYEEGNKSEIKKIDDNEQFNLVKGFNQELPQPKKVKKNLKIIRVPKKNNLDIRDMLQKEKTKSVLEELPSESLKDSPVHDIVPDTTSNQVQTSQENILQTVEICFSNENTILDERVLDTAEKSSSLNNDQISSRSSEEVKEKEDTNKTVIELKEKAKGSEAASIIPKNSKLSITRPSRRSKEKRDPIKTENAEPEKCGLETDPINMNYIEISVTNIHPKENFKKAKNEPEFIKYLEIHQDTLLDEQPDLTQDEIVTYLYQNWLYEESNKSEMKRLDDNEQSNLVKGFNQEIPQPKKIRKKPKVDTNEDIRNMIHKQNLKDVTEQEAICEKIVNGTHVFVDSESIIGDPKLSVTEESNDIKGHNIADQVKDSADNVQILTEVKEEQELSNKSPEYNIKSEIFEIEDIEFDIDELMNQSVSKESAHSKIINGFIEFEENAKKSEANEVFDPIIATFKSEDSVVSTTTRKGRKEKDAKSMNDPDFIKYLEARQDALIEEQPDLTHEEIVTYLYQTWFYEESTKSDVKKSDDTEQSNLFKGLNPEPVPQPIRIKKKPKVEKDATEKVPKNKARPEKALKNADIRDMIQKPKRKATQSKPYYNEDDSDLEEEDLETFKIFDRDEQNEDGEVIDEVELYFEQLTKPKPNVFKGYVRERVCEICYRASNLVKCKYCHGTFHVECVKKEAECTEATGPSRGRKKKRGRKPKGYDPSLDSQSDDRSQDANNSEELNISLEDETESHIVIDETNFETLWENKMKELQSENQEEYISDQEIDWEVQPGLCQIVDLKQKEKPVDYSDYKCNNCTKYNTPVCFVCKSNKSPKDTEVRQKCQVAHCHRYYHLECLEYWPQTQFNSWEPSKNKKQIEYIEALSCPRHVCHTCVSDDPRGCKTRFCGDKLARCVKCPATYHSYTKCLPAGSQILTGSQIICPRHYEHRPGKVPCHVNTGWCFICALGGTLICCEYCPTSFHAECLNIMPPEGSYMCEDCETGRLPLYGEMVWVKLGHYRWWPGIVLHPTEIPDNILAVKHSPGEFVVRFFGQYDHYWVNRGRVFPFQEGDSGRISSQKSKIDAAFTTAMEHAQRACEILKNMEPNEEEDLDIASSLLPPHYVKLKVNKPVGPVVRRDVDANSLTQCDCDPNQPDPCGPYSHCLNRMLLTECGPLCRAGERCNNRAFEKRLYPRLQAYRTPHRGWGLRTLEQIRQGQFVIEYVGELIDMEEFRRRMCRKHEIRDENFYFLTLDKERMIDAGPKGNLARFMNHCCEPNCETQKWTVLGDVRVGLFALRDIPANSEVTFNYNLECAGIEKKRCLCGAKRCSGYIGAKPKQLQEEKTNKSKPATKRTYKKRKPVEEPTTSKPKIPKIKIKPIKPRELTEIEKDVLIIKNATNGMSSDSDGSRLSVEDKNPKALKRKRVSFSTDEVSGKKVKMESDVAEAV